MVVEKLREYKFSIFMIILPFYCLIIRKISTSLFYYPFIPFKDKSFYGMAKINNTNENQIMNITFHNARLFITTKCNKLNLYLKFSEYKYYDDYYLSYDISFNLSELSLIYDDYSFFNANNIKNSSYIVKKYNVVRNSTNFPYFNNLSLDDFSFKYFQNNKTVECDLKFSDFDLSLNLEDEKFTYKFFYLLDISIHVIIHIIVLRTKFWRSNLQNINSIFIYIVWINVISTSMMYLYDLYQIGIPIFDLFKFYPHLLIYGEFLLSIQDVIILISTLFSILIPFIYFIIFFISGNYKYYCFNNIIYNIKMNGKEEQEEQDSFKIFLVVSNSYYKIFFSKSVHMLSFPLIIALISTIFKHLKQREIMCKKDKNFTINFYTFGIIIYSYYILVHSLGKFHRIKPSYAISPFIIIFILYIILLYVLKKEYKFKHAMKKDFDYLRKLNNEVCSICLNNFENNNDRIGKYFCRASENDNIHKTTCNHYFHEKCMFNWRKHGNICPTCKTPLTITDYYFYDEIPCIYKLKWI